MKPDYEITSTDLSGQPTSGTFRFMSGSPSSIYDDWLRTDFFYRHKPYRDFLSSLIWFPLLGLRIMTERDDDDEPERSIEPPAGFSDCTETL